MKTVLNEKIEFENLCSAELLEYISFKEDFPSEAEYAFVEFCKRFEKDILQKAEIYCAKFNYNEVIALQVAHCAFARVWKYPTFKKEKSKNPNVDKSISLWLYPILYTQIIKFGKEKTCSEASAEEDLELITTIDELAGNKTSSSEEKKALKQKLEIIDKAMVGLSYKHRTIYLTYKAYEVQGRNIPRSITKKLQDTLELTQTTVRIYKRDANEHITNFLKQYNGK